MNSKANRRSAAVLIIIGLIGLLLWFGVYTPYSLRRKLQEMILSADKVEVKWFDFSIHIDDGDLGHYRRVTYEVTNPELRRVLADLIGKSRPVADVKIDGTGFHIGQHSSTYSIWLEMSGDNPTRFRFADDDEFYMRGDSFWRFQPAQENIRELLRVESESELKLKFDGEVGNELNENQ